MIKKDREEARDDGARFSLVDLKQEIMLSKDSQQMESSDQSELYESKDQPALISSYLKAYTKHQWLYAAVRRVAQSGAQIPMKLYKWNKQKGEGVELKDHPLLDLLEHPSPNTPGYNLTEATYSDNELAGNAYWEKVFKAKSKQGEIKEIYRIRPDKLMAIPDRKKRVKQYEYGNKPVIFLPEEIVHFRQFNPVSDLYGMAAISPIRNSILSDLYAQKWNMNIFKKGGKILGMFSTDQKLSEDSFKRFKKEVKTNYTGVENANTFVIGDSGLTYANLALNQVEMDYVKLREMNMEEISGGLTVPPFLLGIMRYSNYANASEQRKLFWYEGMVPRGLQYAAVLTTQLCPHYGDDLYFLPDFSFISSLVEDSTERDRLDKELVSEGIMTRNEFRAKRNLAPVDGGDVIYIPFNYTPLSAPAGAVKSVDKKEFLWKEFDRSLIPFEKKMAGVVNKSHKELLAEVMDNIDAKYKPKVKGNIKKDKIDDLMFDIDKAIKRLQKLSNPNFYNVFEHFGSKAVKQINNAINFDLDNPAVLDYLDKKVFNFSDTVIRTTEKQLREELIAGYDNGEAIPALKVRVQEVFDGTIRADGARAEMIARTEVVSSANQASLMGYKQVGVDKKEWIATRDERVRDTHLEADGQIVGIDEKFKVGGEELNAPGDPSGSAGNVIQCRCTVAAVIND